MASFSDFMGEETKPELPEVRLWTDGSSRGNPGPGGYGAILMFLDPAGKEHVLELAEGFELTTNNRMELLAVIAGLERLKRDCRVELYSDSQYVCNAISKGWIWNWQKKGWINSQKEPVKNVDLWKRFMKARRRHELCVHWVKGHAGTTHNERADQLATMAADGELGPLQQDKGFVR